MRFLVSLIGSVLWLWSAAVLRPSLAQSESSVEPPPSPVAVAQVTEQNFAGSQTAVGTVQPARRSIVGSAVDGRVISFPVENGDLVAEGDTLAQLRTETLKWQLTAAEAELTLREQELAELLNGTDPEQIANLEALMKAAAAQRDFTQSHLERIQSLYQRGQVATQTQLDEAQSQATSGLHQHIAAKSLYDLAFRGPRQEKIAQSRARCEVQRAVVSELEEQIARHTVVAPFEGFIVLEHTEVGQWASSGDPIAEVVQLSEVDVRVNVLEGQVGMLHIGQPVTVEVPATAQRQWSGTVHRIIPQADVRSRTFPVDIRVANRIEEGVPVLKAGYLVSVQLPVGRSRRTLAVPKDALVLGGEEPVVYIVDAGATGGDRGIARAVSVTLGQSVGMSIEVQGDLAVNDLVVVEGNERLRTGEHVRILEQVTYE